MTGKVFIAAKQVFLPGGIPTGKYHLYLVYDPNGDPSSTTGQKIIRGGPQGERLGSSFWNEVRNAVDGVTNPGNIELEIDRSLEESLDNFIESGSNPTTRRYTELPPPIDPLTELPMSAEDFWNALKAEANSLKISPTSDADSDGRPLTDAAYTVSEQFGALGMNSNSVIASILGGVGVDVYANLPETNGPSTTRMVASDFPQLQNMFVGGNNTDTVSVTDPLVNSVTDIGSSNSTITVGETFLDYLTETLTLKADTSLLSDDALVLDGMSSVNVRYVQRVGNDLQVFLTDDVNPSLVLKDQFGARPFDTIDVTGGALTLSELSSMVDREIVIPGASGGVAFKPTTYNNASVSLTGSDQSVKMTWNSITLFSYSISAAKATFGDGTEIDLDVDPDLELTAPGEAETPEEATLDYLEQLGVEMTAEELRDEQRLQQFGELTNPTGGGYVEQLSESAACGNM